MTKRLRWGLLGAARINRVIIPCLQRLPRHELVAVASRDLARAESYAAEWGIPVAVGSYEALLARPDIDIVYNPLPNALHAQWTIRAVEAGKHVLCEKPIATSMADIDAVCAAARRTGMCVTEAFMYRYHPQTQRVREVVAGGELGDVRLVRGAFTFSFNRPADIRWSADLDGGALWDVGCYPVSYTRMLVGEAPVDVAALHVQSGANLVDTSVAGVMRHAGGILGTFDCSFESRYRTCIEVVGTRAVLEVPAPFKPSPISRLTISTADAVRTVEIEGAPLYEGELEAMARQVLDGEAPSVSLAETRAATATLVALQRSAREGRRVSLAEVMA